jgi:hypothetical protein
MQSQNKEFAKERMDKIVKIGICEMCNREKEIVRTKPDLCIICMSWITRFIKKRYGYFHRRYVAEAVTFFKKPVECKFFQTCGNYINRFNEEGRLVLTKRAICKRCLPIYIAGWKDRAMNNRKNNNEINSIIERDMKDADKQRQ